MYIDIYIHSIYTPILHKSFSWCEFQVHITKPSRCFHEVISLGQALHRPRTEHEAHARQWFCYRMLLWKPTDDVLQIGLKSGRGFIKWFPYQIIFAWESKFKGGTCPWWYTFQGRYIHHDVCCYGFGQDSGRSLEELQVPFKHQPVQNLKTILPKSFSTELWYEGNQKNHSRAHDQLVWFNGLFQDSETWVSHSGKWNSIFNGKPSSWASMKLQDIGFAGRPGWILPQETLGAAGCGDDMDGD